MRDTTRPAGIAGGTIRYGIRWDGTTRVRTGLALLLALLLAAAAWALTPPGHEAVQTFIVRAQPGARADAERAVERLGGTVRGRLDVVGGFIADVPAGAADRLSSASGVAGLTADRPVHLLTSGSDSTAAASLAAVNTAIRVDGIKDKVDGKGVDVALLDSGVVPVPGLQGGGKVADGPDFSTDAEDPALRGLDAFGHGTHLAGIIAGRQDANGFRGVAPGARIVNVKVADANGATSLGQLLEAIGWVVANRSTDGRNIRVLNLSFGTEPESSYTADPLAAAVEAAWQAGITVVVSAGNDGEVRSGLDSPAYDPFVVAVGALDLGGTATIADDVVPSWSSRGTDRAPDVVAPGTAIVSLRVPGSFLDEVHPEGRFGDSYFRGSGTSQAAAVVSGTAALLIQQRPGLAPDQVKALLRGSGQPLAGVSPQAQGEGRVDALDAFTAATPDLKDKAVKQDKLYKRSKAPAAKVAKPGKGAADVDLAGSRWSGSRWSGSRWSGSRWSGSRWSGGAWGP